MQLIPFLFALIYSVVLMWMLLKLFSYSKLKKAFWPMFVFIMVVVLGSVLFTFPVGPQISGYHWLPGFIATFIVGLLLVTIASLKSKKIMKVKMKKPDPGKPETKPVFHSSSFTRPKESSKTIYQGDETMGSVVVSGVFWIIILLLSLLLFVAVLIDKELFK